MRALVVLSVLAPSYGRGRAQWVQDAVGVRVTARGLGAIEAQLTGRVISRPLPLVGGEPVFCYDSVGIRGATVETSIESVSLDVDGDPSTLRIAIRLARVDIVGGELFGDDANFDVCPQVRTHIDLISLVGVSFAAQIRPWIDDSNALRMDLVGSPEVQISEVAAIDVDPIWDAVEDLVLSTEFVNEFLAHKVAEALRERLPTLLGDTALPALVSGQAGDVGAQVGVRRVDLVEHGVEVALNVGLMSTLPAAPCAGNRPAATFRGTGDFGLGENDDSMLEVAVSEALVNHALDTAWRAGTLCLDDQSPVLASFVSALPGLAAEGMEALDVRLEVQSPPFVALGPEGATLALRDVLVEAHSSFSGQSHLLFRVEADIEAMAVIDVDRETNRILLSVNAISAEFPRFESDVLYSSNPGASEDLIRFVRGYALPRLQRRFTEIPISSAVLAAGQFVVVLDDLRFARQHVQAALSFFDANDPILDRIAPETFFQSTPVPSNQPATVSVSFGGTDDRAGALVFSYKLDENGWSAWDTQRSIELTSLTHGVHGLQVKSRDRFLNEDPTPAVLGFQVSGAGQGPGEANASAGGCSVSHQRARSDAFHFISLLGFLVWTVCGRRGRS